MKRSDNLQGLFGKSFKVFATYKGHLPYDSDADQFRGSRKLHKIDVTAE